MLRRFYRQQRINKALIYRYAIKYCFNFLSTLELTFCQAISEAESTLFDPGSFSEFLKRYLNFKFSEYDIAGFTN